MGEADFEKLWEEQTQSSFVPPPTAATPPTTTPVRTGLGDHGIADQPCSSSKSKRGVKRVAPEELAAKSLAKKHKSSDGSAAALPLPGLKENAKKLLNRDEDFTKVFALLIGHDAIATIARHANGTILEYAQKRHDVIREAKAVVEAHPEILHDPAAFDAGMAKYGPPLLLERLAHHGVHRVGFIDAGGHFELPENCCLEDLHGLAQSVEERERLELDFSSPERNSYWKPRQEQGRVAKLTRITSQIFDYIQAEAMRLPELHLLIRSEGFKVLSAVRTIQLKAISSCGKNALPDFSRGIDVTFFFKSKKKGEGLQSVLASSIQEDTGLSHAVATKLVDRSPQYFIPPHPEHPTWAIRLIHILPEHSFGVPMAKTADDRATMLKKIADGHVGAFANEFLLLCYPDKSMHITSSSFKGGGSIITWTALATALTNVLRYGRQVTGASAYWDPRNALHQGIRCGALQARAQRLACHVL